MSQQQTALICKDATIDSLHRIPTNKNGDTWMLHITCPLTPDMADVLSARQQCFTLDDKPVPDTEVKKGHQWNTTEFSVAGHTLMRPEMVTGFSIKPSKLAGADGDLELAFRIKFKGAKSVGNLLNKLMDRVGAEEFDLSVLPLQGSFFSAESEDTGDGTRVELSGGSTGEDDDDAPPLVKAAMRGDRVAVSDAVKDLTAEEPEEADEPEDEEPAPGTLPSLREMAGGTTAHAKKARGGRVN
jgi:hypothetical protein